MRNDKYLPEITNENFEEWVNTHEDIYVEPLKIKFHQYNDSFRIIDITNAMKKGLVCESFCFDMRNNRDVFSAKVVCAFGSIEAVLSFARGLGLSKYGSMETEFEGLQFMVYKEEIESKRVYSPFALSQIKPLKEAPKKWTLPHVYRALANGQAKGLKCTGHMTDDYAFDASVNCRIGEERDSLCLLQDILQSPSGWRVYEYSNSIQVHCHLFLGYQFNLSIG